MWRKFGEDLLDPLKMGAEIRGRLHQVFCYKDGAETGGLDLEERSEG